MNLEAWVWFVRIIGVNYEEVDSKGYSRMVLVVIFVGFLNSFIQIVVAMIDLVHNVES